MSSKDKMRLDEAQRKAQESIQRRKKTDTDKMRAICAVEADKLRERLK